jgi:hypothetical protein
VGGGGGGGEDRVTFMYECTICDNSLKAACNSFIFIDITMLFDWRFYSDCLHELFYDCRPSDWDQGNLGAKEGRKLIHDYYCL